MNNNILLDLIESYVEKKSDDVAYSIVNCIKKMKAADFTAATDLIAELSGKNPTQVVYDLHHEAMSYEAHLPGAPHWA